MSAMFGTKYFGFIASAYGATFVVLAGMVLWVLWTQAKRKRDLAVMEKLGLRRGTSNNG